MRSSLRGEEARLSRGGCSENSVRCCQRCGYEKLSTRIRAELISSLDVENRPRFFITALSRLRRVLEIKPTFPNVETPLRSVWRCVNSQTGVNSTLSPSAKPQGMFRGLECPTPLHTLSFVFYTKFSWGITRLTDLLKFLTVASSLWTYPTRVDGTPPSQETKGGHRLTWQKLAFRCTVFCIQHAATLGQ